MVDVKQNIIDGVYKNTLEYGKDRESKQAYREEDNRILLQFKKDLLEDFGVTDNPKAEKAWELAWDRGHASGFIAIYWEFEELYELIV